MGIVLGCKRFTVTMLDAITGLIYQPVKYMSLAKYKVIGFFKGLIIGIFSLLKLFLAMFDWLRCVVLGIKNEALYEESMMEVRSRPPRVFRDGKRLVAYRESTATFMELVYRHKI
jgi:hypothetical protein